ncbi:MAG: hypothetical protein F6K55_03195 [Moorea sp. SIO4A3]|nr:hypothetical protein [Moorena sp. SIO4A3]
MPIERNQTSDYVAPQVIIPGLDLECYKLQGKKNYRYGTKGTARAYDLSHNTRGEEVVSSKRFKALFGETLKGEDFLGETKGGTQLIKGFSSEAFVAIGLYQIRFTKDKDQLKKAFEVQLTLAASKLDDMAAELFGDDFSPTQSFLSKLPGYNFFTEKLMGSREEILGFTASQYMEHRMRCEIKDPPFSPQTLGRRSTEVAKFMLFDIPEKEWVKIWVTCRNGKRKQMKVLATVYAGDLIPVIETTLQSLVKQHGILHLLKP